MQVRTATNADAEALAGLFTAFSKPHTGRVVTPAQILARLAACARLETTLIAEHDGVVAGFACLRVVPAMGSDEPVAELTDLFVAEPYRRRGIARALLQEAHALALARGASEVILHTGFDDRVAQSCYRALGYAEWALAMRRPLDSGA
jgi:GNAT superfamily N-acetyltransferase